MKDCTYYDLLGVPMDATDHEITDAKNFLVKKFHPDANMTAGFDTTTYIQNVLNAYKILISPDSRRIYDRRIRNPIRRHSEFERMSKNENAGPLSPNFAPYWESANKLNELVSEGALLLKQKRFGKQELPVEKLTELAAQADPHIRMLEDGEIPRQYWFSYAMNWILFQWSQNRDLPYIMLYSMYESYLEQCKSVLEKRKIMFQTTSFLTNLDKLITYKQLA